MDASQTRVSRRSDPTGEASLASAQAVPGETLLQKVSRLEAIALSVEEAERTYRGGSTVLLHVYELGSGQSADSRARLLANAIRGVNSVTQSIAGVGGLAARDSNCKPLGEGNLKLEVGRLNDRVPLATASTTHGHCP